METELRQSQTHAKNVWVKYLINFTHFSQQLFELVYSLAVGTGGQVTGLDGDVVQERGRERHQEHGQHQLFGEHLCLAGNDIKN